MFVDCPFSSFFQVEENHTRIIYHHQRCQVQPIKPRVALYGWLTGAGQILYYKDAHALSHAASFEKVGYPLWWMEGGWMECDITVCTSMCISPVGFVNLHLNCKDL